MAEAAHLEAQWIKWNASVAGARLGRQLGLFRERLSS